MDGKAKKTAGMALKYIILIILAILWVVPIITLVFTAVKSKGDFFSGMSLFQMPENIAWDNFTNAMTKGRLFQYMKNDLIICCLKVPLGIFVEAMAAFAITRLTLKKPTAWFTFFLIGMMLPMALHWFRSASFTIS